MHFPFYYAKNIFLEIVLYLFFLNSQQGFKEDIQLTGSSILQLGWWWDIIIFLKLYLCRTS